MSTNGRGSNKPTIILIHGLWLTPRSWEHWIDRYQKAGYNVMAPSWPGLEGEVEALRRDPTPLKGLKLSTVIDHYVRIITKLPNPPILMGHSFGGLIVHVFTERARHFYDLERLWRAARRVEFKESRAGSSLPGTAEAEG